MKRPMGRFEVQQRTKDGMFNATNLLEQWNKLHPQNTRRLNNFWQSSHLYEFMLEIVKDPENGFTLPDSTYLNLSHVDFKSQKFRDFKNMLSSNSRARADRGGGTWMHPYLFVKFAMYLNPAFEYQVVKFVSDQLIKQRHEIGDGYKQMCRSLSKGLGAEQSDFIRVAKMNNWIVYGQHNTDLRQQGDPDKIKEMAELQGKVCFMVEMGFVNSTPELLQQLRQLHAKKHPEQHKNLLRGTDYEPHHEPAAMMQAAH